MALAGEIIRYIGNEFVPMATKTASSSLSSVIPSAITKTGASLATKAATSALGNVTNKAISNAANKSVEKSVLQNIGGRIFQNGKPKSFYHGSPNPNIDKLDLSKAGSNTQSGENVLYFTDDYPTAEEFSYERLPSNSMFINNRGKKGKVYEKQLNLKNLVDLGNLSDEQIGNLYEYADAINRYDGKEKFIQRVKEDLLAGNDQSIKTRLDLNALKNSDYDGFIAKMYPNQKGLENVREYGVFNPDNVRDVRHIPVEESSSLSSIIPVKRKLYRGQQYSNTDFSYNSELMNENPDKWGSKDVGKGYHFTPKKDMAGSWEGSNGGVIEVDYTPDQVLKADDARKMIEEANKLLADDKYMAKLWQENEAMAEQIEKIADGNLEALAKREGKPFVQHLKANDDELGTMYYYKDIDPELTDRFVSEFKKKAEKYIPKRTSASDDDMVTLFHNTKAENIPSIMEQGLIPGKRIGGYLASPEEAGIWTDDGGLTSGSYGGTTVKIRVPKKEFDATRVNDTQNLLNRVIKPSEIEGVDYMLYDTPLIKNSNLQEYIDKYGEDKVRELIEKKGLVSPEVIDKSFNDLKSDMSLSAIDIKQPDAKLSPEQQEFFKDSVVRDENGMLKKMYHGSPNGKIKEFNPGSYFTENKEYADGYQNPEASSLMPGARKIKNTPKTYEVYLNIKKPFTLSDARAKDIYLNEYIKGGNSAYYDPYGTTRKMIDDLDEVDWTEGTNLMEWLQENHPEYDGMYLDEGGTGGYSPDNEYVDRGKSLVNFRSDQVKILN